MPVTDALEIEALLSRYCFAVDSKDWVSYRALFTDDARVDYAAAGLVVGTVDDAVDFLGHHQQSISVGMHYVTNVESTVEQDHSQTVAMWFNAVQLPGGDEISYFAGRWHDDLVRTPAGWRIRNLRLEGGSVSWADDQLEIRALLARYARGVDTKDWELYRSVFTEDAHVDYTSAGAIAGSREEVIDWLSAGFATIPWSMHYITNVEADIDGDTARVRAMFYNPMQLPGMSTQSACGGYYHHELVRTAQGWRSRRLREENVWFSNPPVR